MPDEPVDFEFDFETDEGEDTKAEPENTPVFDPKELESLKAQVGEVNTLKQQMQQAAQALTGTNSNVDPKAQIHGEFLNDPIAFKESFKREAIMETMQAVEAQNIQNRFNQEYPEYQGLDEAVNKFIAIELGKAQQQGHNLGLTQAYERGVKAFDAQMQRNMQVMHSRRAAGNMEGMALRPDAGRGMPQSTSAMPKFKGERDFNQWYKEQQTKSFNY